MLASCCLDNSLRHALQAIIIQIHGRYANPSMFYATKSEQVYSPFDIWILIPSILQILIPLRLILFSIAHGLFNIVMCEVCYVAAAHAWNVVIEDSGDAVLIAAEHQNAGGD